MTTRCASAPHFPLPRVFEALEAAGLAVKHGRQQVMVSCDGRKVGGWNTRNGHWYVSKVIALGRDALLERYGFRWMEKPGHEWWQLDGADNAHVFVAVTETLTGVRIELNQ